MTVLEQLELPIVGAPMAGGPSTPELAAAVSEAGGLGVLAAGYLTAGQMAERLAAVRVLTARPIGVNLFAAGGARADPALVARYAARLAPEAQRLGVELGAPRFDDDDLEAKVDHLCAEPVAVVSFTFGLPSGEVAARLRAAGSELWATVTAPDEAQRAAALGVDALVVQGVEAGGHRGVFCDDEHAADVTLLAALQLVGAGVDLPLVAAGALMTGGAVAAVLAAGAAAAQLGTAYLRTPEAGTSPVQRAATAQDAPTVLTRAFSGRTARGIVNRLHAEHGAHAPSAYPEIHHVTAPLRARARAQGDGEVINLWAGQAHVLARDLPAAQLTRALADEARAALARAGRRLGEG
ncbi:nitronate monooxygenase [Baekduia soli]|uniref:Propionate 3-nitronate monooxygenase n=1 Tax=Baekduia soli TaxID=496014 RepID=A0A5B8U0E7_9ACTN|nr:nitronate monooxygenase [Baekduia soli]QEC46428.1 nitronate monooxygenase [Baekduia soli]